MVIAISKPPDSGFCGSVSLGQLAGITFWCPWSRYYYLEMVVVMSRREERRWKVRCGKGEARRGFDIEEVWDAVGNSRIGECEESEKHSCLVPVTGFRLPLPHQPFEYVEYIRRTECVLVIC
jgi:hypothetical protein